MGLLGSAKPLASLSSGLLARKGQARPAMRPQGFASMIGSPWPQAEPAEARLDDLGWNDMGDAVEPIPAVLVAREVLVRELAAAEPDAEAEVGAGLTIDVVPESIPAPAAISLATARRIGRESAGQTKKGKAAFTLRLDGERHLRLRLASAVSHRSAQLLVVEAVDRLLATMPEVDTLVAQLSRAGGGR